LSARSRPGADDGLLEIGRITKAHGLRGEVVVQLSSDYPDVRLAPESRLRTGQDDLVLVVRSARPHQDRWLVLFEGVGDRTAAERLAGRTLRGAPIDDPDALWVHELIGARVIEAATGVERGRVTSVVANPAHDLLELDSGVLVPIVFVRSLEDGVATVDPPAGLFDLEPPD
jgi:16S rRNA processing protein RimM